MNAGAPKGGAALRDSEPGDLPAIAAIYGHHVATGFGSFEEDPPSVEELGRRRADVLERGLPFLVAIRPGGEIAGYAYASPFRMRPGYGRCLEDSIYVAPEALRSGVGTALLAALIERCAAAGYRQLVAVIGDSANAASIALHERAGFQRVGVLRSVGYKRRRWIDAVLMQRDLGEGASAP